MRWVVAIEEDWELSQRTDSNTGRVHAYDIIKGELAHPFEVGYTVDRNRMWADPVEGPRCRHCVELVSDAGG